MIRIALKNKSDNEILWDISHKYLLPMAFRMTNLCEYE
jgi:hypothetical protein